MLKAARAQGMPMIVTTMMSPAASQAIAIHRPPNSTQRMLRKSGSGAMASISQIAELAAQISLARSNLALHRLEARFEIAETPSERGERVVGRGGDTAPEGSLLAARVKRRRPFRQRDRQEDVGEHCRNDKEEQRQHKGEADDDAFGAEIVGDAGADAGQHPILGVAIKTMAAVR